ncbi:MAG: DUF1569 domain-containing protein [Pirellulales bacterium]
MSSPTTDKPLKRRQLFFQTFNEVLIELDRMESRPQRTIGKWSLGQILKHLAVPIDGAVDGISVQMPWHLRFSARLFKPIVMRMRMPAGFQLPKQAAAVMVPGPTESAEGFAALRNSINKFNAATEFHPHPVLGTLTKKEWEMIMCRHCELHLSFALDV